MLIRTLLVWLLGVPITIFIFIFVILSLVFDRSGNTIHSLARLWGRSLLFLSGVSVDISGVEHFLTDRPQILFSNHQGAFDILVLQAFIPVQFRWVAKKSLFKIPIIGWSMSLAGYVSIEREKPSSAYRSIEAAAEKVKHGTSVLIFPEGTRSAQDKLLPFKRGGFLIAMKSGVPIVPISIKGTSNIMKRGSFLIRPERVKVIVNKSISTIETDEKILMSDVKKAIEHGLL